MGRRRRNKEPDLFELIAKLVFGGLLLISLSIGGISGFGKVFSSLIGFIFWLVIVAAAVAVIGGLLYFIVSHYRSKPRPNHGWSNMPDLKPGEAYQSETCSTEVSPPPIPTWTIGKIEESLGEIDWYQFEKFCAALLRSEGFSVERKGGAQPDGGVDLVATKNDEPMLVQCKHWKTWTVQEKVIRELLGSMTHYQVKRGALYVLKGATRPAQTFAAQYDIHVADGRNLAERARNSLSDSELTAVLSSRDHHCPRCESLMVWRTGNFTPFWGCSTYPRCRATLKHSGAR